MNSELNVGGLCSQPLQKRNDRNGQGYAKWLAGFNQPFEIKFPWGGSGNSFSLKNAAGTSLFSINQAGTLTIGSFSTSNASSISPSLVVGGGSTLTGLGSGTSQEIKTSQNSTSTNLIVYNDATGTSGAAAIGFAMLNAGGSARKISGQITTGKVGAYTAGNENGYMSFSTSSSGSLNEVFRIYDTKGFSIGNTTDPGSTNLSVTGTSLLTGGIIGVSTNSNATAGNVGEFVSSLVAVGSAVSLTTVTTANVTSISLTAGDWDVEGNVNFTETTATASARSAGITSTSATVPNDGSEGYCGVQSTVTSETNTIALTRKRFSLSGTTTIYLVAQATFSAGTVGGFGQISARRIR